MKQTITFSQFCDSFSDTYKNNFSYAGKRALFDYLEEYENGTGEEVELDPVALCCDYSEYDSAVDAMKQYEEDAGIVQHTNTEDMDLVEISELAEKEAHAWLEEHTTVIDVEGGGVIIQAF